MKGYTDADLSALLTALSLHPGDDLLVHSSLFNLGVYRPYPLPETPSRLLARLAEYTPDGALVMPTFGYDFPKTRQCDLTQMPSQMGILTETLRQQTGIRSGHPMFSFTATGAKAVELLQPNTPEYDPFGLDSVFGRLYQHNALILMLGTTLSVCTYLMYCERHSGVRYRFYKPFYGTVTLSNGSRCTDNFYHFCFPLDGSIREDYREVTNRLLAVGILQKHAIGMGQAYWFRARELFDAVAQYLATEPWLLLREPPKTFWAMRDGVETAIGLVD